MELFVGFLRRLRAIADEHAARFRSPGFTRFFAMLAEELDEEYFELIEDQLKELKFQGGMLISARAGRRQQGHRLQLRDGPGAGLLERAMFDRSGLQLHDPRPGRERVQGSGRARGQGINLVANALAQSIDHVLSFFTMLRVELGFYIGCLNLHERLTEKGEPTALPIPLAAGRARALAPRAVRRLPGLTIDGRVVGNDVDADGKSLVMITGANQGGKSTFLRSVGSRS